LVLTATNGRLGEAIQPACEAGGESTSPRRWRSRAWGQRYNVGEPAKLATDGSRSIFVNKEFCESGYFAPFICRPLRGLGHVLGSIPQARLRHRLGLALSPPALQAR
jgi:hypothetical protein